MFLCLMHVVRDQDFEDRLNVGKTSVDRFPLLACFGRVKAFTLMDKQAFRTRRMSL